MFVNQKMFVCCLFVCLFIFCLFFVCLNHHGIPTVRFGESLIKIGLDLTNILLIENISLFVCLFVCLLVWFLFESSWDTHMKILWKFGKDQTWFGWDKNVCFLVCLFFLFESSWDTHRKISWKFCKDQTWFC